MVVLSLASTGLCLAAPADAYVYWANSISSTTSTIGRVSLDGSSVNQNFITATGAFGVAVDAQHVYWTNSTGTIGRANLDGSGVNQSFIAGAGDPSGVAVDGQHVYWAEGGQGNIGRANLDGSGVNGGFIAGASEGTSGVAVDAQHVYWTNTGQGTIGRANLDGSGVNQSFITGASLPYAVAADGQHVYWVNWAGGSGTTIGRANLNGTGINQSFITGAISPLGVTVDAQHVYWTNTGDGTIGRANVDGSGVNQSFITAAGAPQGIAVDSGPPGTATASASGLSFASQPVKTSSLPQQLTITNTGHGSLHVSTARIAGGDFALSSDDCSGTTLLIGGSCTVGVSFSPSATGIRTGTLTVSSDDSTGAGQVPLSGTGVKRPTSLAVNCSPGSVLAGQSTTCTATVTEAVGGAVTPTGFVTLAIGGVDQFSPGRSCTLSGSGASASCKVSFTPIQFGTQTISTAYSSDLTHDPATGSTAVSVLAVSPVAGTTATVTVLSGTVLVKLPGLAGRAADTKAQPGFVPLKGVSRIPVGATVDARKGTLNLSTAADDREASDRRHRVQVAKIEESMFTVEQLTAKEQRAVARRRHQRRLSPPSTDLKLANPPNAAAAAHCHRTGSPGTGLVRGFQAVALKGVYRTIGAASTTTVHNATWRVDDYCNGTLTEISRGSARVTFTSHAHQRTVTVRCCRGVFIKGRFPQGPPKGSLKSPDLAESHAEAAILAAFAVVGCSQGDEWTSRFWAAAGISPPGVVDRCFVNGSRSASEFVWPRSFGFLGEGIARDPPF